MAKTPLLTAVTGAITTADTGNSFEVTDLSAPKTLRVQGLNNDDALNVMVQNFAGDGFVPWTDGDGQVQLNAKRRSVTPFEIGVFAVEGSVGGTVTIYTEDAL